MTALKDINGPLLAAVDLGSNSFRLLIGREEAGQIVSVSTHRESVRLAAGLDKNNVLSEAKIAEACAALARFRERIGAIGASHMRAVATSTYRVATNSSQLLKASGCALGFDIDIISGHEEARLIYVGCAHTLPWSEKERLIIDIGGGSTEFIVGRGFTPELTESFNLGAVTLSQNFFPDGVITSSAFRKSELFVRSRLEVLQKRYKKGWQLAYGSSGTVRALEEIIVENNLGSEITVDALNQLKQILIETGNAHKLNLNALKANRAPVIAGGLSILLGLMLELNIEVVEPSEGALRLGVLYDLLHRDDKASDNDPRTITVSRLQRRYAVDKDQALNVAALAEQFWRQLAASNAPTSTSPVDARLAWASALHEIGMAIAHEDYHQHSAYIIEHADLYGFSEQERNSIGQLVFGHTGSLRKLDRTQFSNTDIDRLICLRLAALLCHGRSGPAAVGELSRKGDGFNYKIRSDWLTTKPLTVFLLEEEAAKWLKFGVPLFINTR